MFKKKLKKIFRKYFLSEKSPVKDFAVFIIIFEFGILLWINHWQLSLKQKESAMEAELSAKMALEKVIEIDNEAEAEIPDFDMADWKTYQTQWYGFELKYPENWKKPMLKSATRGAEWEYRYQFRKSEDDEISPYAGFDVIVYNAKKTRELSETEEFPAIKNEELKNQGSCKEIAEYISKDENYSAGRFYIDANDECYEKADFYTLSSDKYIYNIIPVLNKSDEGIAQWNEEIKEDYPEFISVAASFSLVDIKRPRIVPLKPKITVPKPSADTKRDSQGRMVCAKKGDKPSKSDNTKKKHLDMECCLDPDEYPNPHCYYPPSKYGKYLK